MPMTFGNIKENDHEMLSKLEESTPKTLSLDFFLNIQNSANLLENSGKNVSSAINIVIGA